jgi:hypothetical protein
MEGPCESCGTWRTLYNCEDCGRELCNHEYPPLSTVCYNCTEEGDRED